MKKIKFILIIFISAFLFLSKNVKSQELRDTIITKKNDSIICKITKITEADIEYKKDIAADAIVYVISKDKVRELRLANGKVERIMRDELDMNIEAEIIDKRSAVKFHFFSPLYDHLAVSYEKSLKMGTNMEASVGFINNSMFDFGVSSGSKLTQGAYISVGPKFILGQSYYVKGMKFSHPLKGRYFKPEIIFTEEELGSSIFKSLALKSFSVLKRLIFKVSP